MNTKILRTRLKAFFTGTRTEHLLCRDAENLETENNRLRDHANTLSDENRRLRDQNADLQAANGILTDLAQEITTELRPTR